MSRDLLFERQFSYSCLTFSKFAFCPLPLPPAFAFPGLPFWEESTSDAIIRFRDEFVQFVLKIKRQVVTSPVAQCAPHSEHPKFVNTPLGILGSEFPQRRSTEEVTLFISGWLQDE